MEILASIGQISQASSPFLLALAVWAFATGKIVPRWIFDESVKREAAWSLLYQREKETSERLIGDRERRDQGNRDMARREQERPT